MTNNNKIQLVQFNRNTTNTLAPLKYSNSALAIGDLVTVDFPLLDPNGVRIAKSVTGTFNGTEIIFTSGLTQAESELLILANPVYLDVKKVGSPTVLGGIRVIISEMSTGLVISCTQKGMYVISEPTRDPIGTCDDLFYFKGVNGETVKVDKLDTVCLVGATAKEIDGQPVIEIVSTTTPLLIPVNPPALIDGQTPTVTQAIESLQGQINTILDKEASKVTSTNTGHKIATVLNTTDNTVSFIEETITYLVDGINSLEYTNENGNKALYNKVTGVVGTVDDTTKTMTFSVNGVVSNVIDISKFYIDINVKPNTLNLNPTNFILSFEETDGEVHSFDLSSLKTVLVDNISIVGDGNTDPVRINFEDQAGIDDGNQTDQAIFGEQLRQQIQNNQYKMATGEYDGTALYKITPDYPNNVLLVDGFEAIVRFNIPNQKEKIEIDYNGIGAKSLYILNSSGLIREVQFEEITGKNLTQTIRYNKNIDAWILVDPVEKKVMQLPDYSGSDILNEFVIVSNNSVDPLHEEKITVASLLNNVPATTISELANGNLEVSSNGITGQAIRALNELLQKTTAVNKTNDRIAILDTITNTTLWISPQDLIEDEVVRQSGAFSGAAPSGKELGIDTTAGKFYYKDSAGNWQLQPVGTTVSLIDNADGTLTVNAGLGGTEKAIRPINELGSLVGSIDRFADRLVLFDASTSTHVASTIQTLGLARIFRTIQTLNGGSNTVLHGLGNTFVPQPVSVEVRNNTTGEEVPVRVTFESGSSLSIFVPVTITNARITIIG